MEPNGPPSPSELPPPADPATKIITSPRPVPAVRPRLPGRGPAIVLMHGFPDDLHLYDRLVPELAGRRVVSFDFLGWGASDKP